MRLSFVCLAAMALTSAHAAASEARLRGEASAVSIVRDEWGIAHVFGRSDADAVFGAIYAQAEDDFRRIEHNYLVALGRLAEAEGESATYSDLRRRLFIDPDMLRRAFGQSPDWLKSLMRAWADGLNFYLSVHPEVKPAVITHFEPWMALSFTEGSIGGDIETVDLHRLRNSIPISFGRTAGIARTARRNRSPKKSLGRLEWLCDRPATERDRTRVALDQPHTSFYFRAELQMSSDQGLDAYGAADLGAVLHLSGFQSHNGWMHTSYGGDAIDEYAETVIDSANKRFYRYAGSLRPLEVVSVDVKVKRGAGFMTRRFTLPHHGPVVRAEGDRGSP